MFEEPAETSDVEARRDGFSAVSLVCQSGIYCLQHDSTEVGEVELICGTCFVASSLEIATLQRCGDCGGMLLFVI